MHAMNNFEEKYISSLLILHNLFTSLNTTANTNYIHD